MLWNKFGDYDILKEHIDRRVSPNHTEIMAMSEDIIDALHDLEENEIDVIYYVVNWHQVLKVKPEAISDLSVRETLAEIEAKFKLYDNTLSELKKESVRIEDRVTNVENDSGMHDNMLQQLASSEATTRGKKTMPSVQETYQRQGASQSNIPAFKLNRGNQAPGISETGGISV